MPVLNEYGHLLYFIARMYYYQNSKEPYKY